MASPFIRYATTSRRPPHRADGWVPGCGAAIVATVKRILVIFPTAWDERQLDVCRNAWEGRYELTFAEPSDDDCPWDLDLPAYVEETAARYGGRIDGVFSSSDYPGATVAAALATRLGLPGSSPAAVLSCSHKHASRVLQQQAVPEATPRFALIDAGEPEKALPDLFFPCFVKPVKGAFSIHSRRIDSAEELLGFFRSEVIREFTGSYMHLFNQLVARYTDLTVDGRYFLAEELLAGLQVTVEGFVQEGRVEILGVVDSLLHPRTQSFSRFDYPSFHRREVQERMADVARRAIAGIGIESTFWNVEMIYEPARDSLHVIEINPRICGQFADLYEKVDGTHAYPLALALAAGEPATAARRQGRYRQASSFPLRVFEPVHVERAPTAADVAAAEALYPGTLVWTEAEEGSDLADFDRFEDGSSARYGIVNVGADSRRELLARFRAVRERLGFDLRPLTRLP